jgi:hypothetical protein
MGFVVDDFTYVMSDPTARRWYISFPEEWYFPKSSQRLSFTPNIFFLVSYGRYLHDLPESNTFHDIFVLHDAKKN